LNIKPAFSEKIKLAETAEPRISLLQSIKRITVSFVRITGRYSKKAASVAQQTLVRVIKASQKTGSAAGRIIKRYWTLGITRGGYYLIKGLTGKEIEVKSSEENTKK